MAGLLALTYGFLFVTLRAEGFALLMGTLGLFGVRAAVMYATRGVDWYGVSLGAGQRYFRSRCCPA